MKASEILKKIEAVLLSSEVKLEQMKLDNGTVLEAETFESGQPVFIVSEDERVPVPVGEYMTEDGQKLIIQEEGVIASMGESEEPEEEPELTEQPELTEEPELTEQPVYVTKEELDSLKTEILTEIQKLSSQSPELKKELEQPAVKPFKHNPETKTERKPAKLSGQSAVNNVFARFANRS